MGAGKTAVSELLSQRLGLERIDMDELIVARSGRNSDREIFATDGEIVFRELEISVAKELQQKDNVVISTGGGVVMNKIIIDYLRYDATIVFLKHSFETAKKRLGKENVPPLFKNEAVAKELYGIRLPLYTQYSHLQITTDDKTLEEVTEEIITQLNHE